jgi:hypothetical protein
MTCSGPCATTSDSLEVTSALKSRLFWMYKSHQRIDHQVAAVLAILDRRLRSAPALLPKVDGGFMEVVERLIETSEGQFPTLTDLARDVRYRYFEQPIFERGRQAVYAEMEAHLAHVMRDPGSRDREARIQALVECPLPLGGLLSGRFDDAAPVLRQIMLEVLTRRFYRIRGVGQCDAREVAGRSICLAHYEHEGRALHVVASHARWGDLPAVLATAVADAHPTTGADACREDAAAADDTARDLVAMLDASAFRRPLRRVVVAVAGRRADWAASGTEYFTLRMDEGRWHEDRLYRGLHPMVGKRLGVARFQRFAIERLPSVEDVFLFKATSRENAKDECSRWPVHDVTPDATRTARWCRTSNMVFEAAAAIRGAGVGVPTIGCTGTGSGSTCGRRS